MKRRIFELGLFLLLGAIINVGVAWGFAIFVKQPILPSPTVMAENRNRDLFYVRRMAVPGAMRVRAIQSDWETAATVSVNIGGPPTQATPVGMPEPIRRQPRVPMDTQLPQFSRHLQDKKQSFLLDARGWPLLSLWCNFDPEGTNWTASPSQSGIPMRDSRDDSVRVLPLRPIWRGFAINTIFYAALLWLPFAAVGRLRRRRRIKRGLCPACAYPVGDSPVCTECGKAVQG